VKEVLDQSEPYIGSVELSKRLRTSVLKDTTIHVPVKTRAERYLVALSEFIPLPILIQWSTATSRVLRSITQGTPKYRSTMNTAILNSVTRLILGEKQGVLSFKETELNVD